MTQIEALGYAIEAMEHSDGILNEEQSEALDIICGLRETIIGRRAKQKHTSQRHIDVFK